jgi:hypothetical protein
MNRGIEIASDVADGTRSLILDQVSNGLAVRMAVLYLLAGGSLLGQQATEQAKHEAEQTTLGADQPAPRDAPPNPKTARPGAESAQPDAKSAQPNTKSAQPDETVETEIAHAGSHDGRRS